MPQYLILAYDGADAEAPARRQRVRAEHFAGIAPMVARGELRAAGAILDDAGNMVGSAVFAEFASRETLDAWLAREPYVRDGVWRRIEIKPFRLAVLDGRVTP